MTAKRFIRELSVLAAIGTLPLSAFADEIVHFTNGAEMTVRSHTVEKEKNMVKLDLGANSFIAFPMAMVDKIVNAGRDVFLNPSFHPSNQAIGGVPGGAVADNTIRGTGDPSGFVRRPGKGTAGVMLGEAADAVPIPAAGGQLTEPTPVASSRRVFNPAVPSAPGALPQVIMPPGRVMTPVQLVPLPSRPEPPPPADNEAQDNQPAGDPDTENPPEAP